VEWDTPKIKGGTRLGGRLAPKVPDEKCFVSVPEGIRGKGGGKEIRNSKKLQKKANLASTCPGGVFPGRDLP